MINTVIGALAAFGLGFNLAFIIITFQSKQESLNKLQAENANLRAKIEFIERVERGL